MSTGKRSPSQMCGVAAATSGAAALPRHAADLRTDRRAFLRQTVIPALASLAPSVISRTALGLGDAAAPSNRITLGFIGIGCMGQGHLAHLLTYPDVQVVAVCDVDTWRRENAQQVVDEAYAARRTAGDYAGCVGYVDFRDLLARDDIDAVVIAMGDRWHAVATVMAAEAGKDIYVEKPVSLRIAETRAMVEAVRRHGRVCQVGLQQRSAPEFRLATQLVRDGALGRIRRIYTIHNSVSSDVDLPAEPTPETLDWDRWIGPSPWRPFNHRLHYLGTPLNVVPWEFVRDFGGGGLTSGAVHALDVVQWALEWTRRVRGKSWRRRVVRCLMSRFTMTRVWKCRSPTGDSIAVITRFPRDGMR